MGVAVDHAATQLISGAVMHQAAMIRARAEAREHLLARDGLIHQLRAIDSTHWTYARIANEVGLTAKNVVYILGKSS
jgi:hypothetical protein